MNSEICFSLSKLLSRKLTCSNFMFVVVSEKSYTKFEPQCSYKLYLHKRVWWATTTTSELVNDQLSVRFSENNNYNIDTLSS